MVTILTFRLEKWGNVLGEGDLRLRGIHNRIRRRLRTGTGRNQGRNKKSKKSHGERFPEGRHRIYLLGLSKFQGCADFV
jgi:hypothetical protein